MNPAPPNPPPADDGAAPPRPAVVPYAITPPPPDLRPRDVLAGVVLVGLGATLLLSAAGVLGYAFVHWPANSLSLLTLAPILAVPGAAVTYYGFTAFRRDDD